MRHFRIRLTYTLHNTFYERVTNAKFGDDLSFEFSHDSGEEYYRQRLTGEITFCNEDYTFIIGADIDTKIQFYLESQIQTGGDWLPELTGYFYLTDCSINQDDNILSVSPTTDDGYDEFLGDIDKEFDLIKLAPRITPVWIDKRPCLQIYAAGDTKLTNILSNMWWEQDCQEERDPAVLTGDYKFAQWNELVSVVVSGEHTPSVPSLFTLKQAQPTGGQQTRTLTSGNYRLSFQIDTTGTGSNFYAIFQNNTQIFYLQESAVNNVAFPRTVTLNAVSGSGATGTCILNIDVAQLYARMICDSPSILGAATVELPLEDIVDNNRNYGRVAPVTESGDLTSGVSSVLSSTPTEWGIYQPDQYYTQPLSVLTPTLPICRSRWSRVSYWISQSSALQVAEKDGRQPILLKDAYLLTDVINALLAEMGTGRTVSSEILRAHDPLTLGDAGILYISPKSNVLNINHTEPAQKAPITLRQILDMLRVMFRCYWELSAGLLVIEHIEWFRRGGSYTGTSVTLADLTATKAVRNNKLWGFQQNTYQYDKPDMPCRYEFGWMDDATAPFKGEPVEMLSGFVNKERVESFTVAGFSADIDYLMLNPSGASKDGFAIMKADYENRLARPITIDNDSESNVLMTYKAEAEETVVVEYDCNGAGTIIALDVNGNRIADIAQWSTTGDTSDSWTIPAGTAQIAVSPLTPVMTFEFRLSALYSTARKVTYWTANEGTTEEHELQNGFLAFDWLRRYYFYDMPCRSYSIDGVTGIALGVSKKKTQEVSFPLSLAGPYGEVKRPVRTAIGYGKIRKLTLNLSAEAAQATLEYDTQ